MTYPNSAVDDWPRARRTPALVLSVGFLALLAAGGLAGAAWAAADGQAGAAVLLAVAAVYIGHIVGLGLSLWRHPRAGDRPAGRGTTDTGASGLSFGYARAPYYWLLSVLGLTALLLLGIAVVAAAGGGAAGWAVAVLALLLALAVGGITVVMARLAPGRIVLTPDGIYHRALTFEHFVPWYAVYDVTAEAGDLPMLVVKAQPSDGTRIRRHAGRLGGQASQYLPFLVVRAHWLGANAVPAYRAADHYFRHPDRRPELAGARLS